MGLIIHSAAFASDYNTSFRRSALTAATIMFDQVPRADLQRPRQLVAAPWLAAQCANGMPAHWRLIEVGCGDLSSFTACHLRGASYLDTTELETGPYWNRVSDADLLALLLRHGVSHDSTVILYGRSALAPARAAHLMLYAGVTDVRLIDGGWDACLAAGVPRVSGRGRMHAPAPAFGAAFPGRPELLADTSAVRRLLATPGASVVSIRTWAEHSGATSGYPYIAERGDIPGARWGRAGEDGNVNSMSAYHDARLCMRDANRISAMWAEQGILPDALATVFYCGTGWRASLAFFYAWLMGWEHISVYDGGWLEWSQAAPGSLSDCKAG